jgi:hypothetical protein
MFDQNPAAMNSTVMAEVLADLERTFDVELTYFGRRKKPPFWEEINL